MQGPIYSAGFRNGGPFPRFLLAAGPLGYFHGCAHLSTACQGRVHTTLVTFKLFSYFGPMFRSIQINDLVHYVRHTERHFTKSNPSKKARKQARQLPNPKYSLPLPPRGRLYTPEP